MADWFEIGAGLLGTLGGAYIAANAAGKASDAAVGAANASNATQERIYAQAREDAAPYRDVGGNALYQLASLGGVEYEGAPGTIEDRYQTALGRFEASPDYQFRLDQGLQAMDRSAASRGRLLSGATLKGAQEYGQNLASSEYGNYTNRLAALAGIGQTATQSVTGSGQNYANAVSANNTNAGNARASGYVGTANAINKGIENSLYYLGR